MYPLRTDVDLTLMIKKLGHDVEEIRVRTLKNLLNKVELKLLFEEDLVQEQTLLIRLLEWFNFPSCPMKQEVLSFLRSLSKHSSASELLVRIGAVEFLSELRPDCDSILQPIIDDILENLFKLPEPSELSPPSFRRYGEECHYHQKTPQDREQSAGVDFLTPIQDPVYDTPQSFFPTETKQRNLSHDQMRQLSPTLDGMKGVKFSTFPWLILTPTDKHVLSSTNNSLCSPRQDVVITSCNFLSDVVLQDFPAEIFLQRPSIVKSLLAILALKPPQVDDQSLILRAVQCLSDLCQYLFERYNFYHDPDLYCPKQEFGTSQLSAASSSQGLQSRSTSQSNLSSNSRPSVVGHQGPRVGGDGRDWDSPSSDGVSGRAALSSDSSGSGPDSEDPVSLQFAQITLPQFCSDVLQRALSVCQYFTNLEMSTRILGLLWKLLKLMKLSMSPDVWSDTGLSGRALIDKLSDSFEILADVLFQLNHQLEATDDKGILLETFQRYIPLAAFATGLTISIVPVSMASSVLPESLGTVFYQLVNNPYISLCLPQVHLSLVPYLKQMNDQLLKRYEDSKIIALAVAKAAEFLEICDKEEADSVNLFSIAEQSLPGLLFEETFPVINKFVHLCSTLASKQTGGGPDDFHQLLLKFLTIPSLEGQKLTTSVCCSIVEQSLNISNAADPACQASRDVMFLLQPSTLKEVAEKLSHNDKQIQEAAGRILLHLLTGRLLMQEDVWIQLMSACTPSLALIQAHSSQNQALQDALRALLVFNSEASYEGLSLLQQLRLALRFLLLKDLSDSKEIAKVVVKFLLEERDGSSKLPHQVVIIPEQISLLLMFDKPLPLEEDVGRSVFEVDSLVQMFNIFRSPDTEDSLRKSSAGQLAIILQDKSLHEAFLSQNGLEVILQLLQTGIQKAATPKVNSDLLASCGKILRLLVHANPKLRHELAGQMSVYLCLLRCALLCQREEKARRDFCHLLVLLLFDEVAGVSFSDDGLEHKFCLPYCVKAGCKLPFACPPLRALHTSGLDYPRLMPASDDPLPLRSVKLAWGLAVNHGCSTLTKGLMAGIGTEAERRSSLDLSEKEKLLVMHSYPWSAVKLALKSITSATSHYGVKQVLWQLSHWLALEQSTLLRGADDDDEVTVHIQSIMMQEDLMGTLARFLGVTPANPDDKSLLQEVFSFLTNLLQTSGYSEHLIASLKSHIGERTPLLELLGQSAEVKPILEGSTDHDKKEKKSDLLKQVLSFVSVFVQNLQRSSEAWMLKGHFVGSFLVGELFQGLHLADEFHYYDLPSLEATLKCLMHITARSGWSLDWSGGDSYTLCQQLLKSLLEVVSAFHIGRGGIAISFMGKGVTRNATLCLLHLSHEMKMRAPDKNWPEEWLHEVPGSTTPGLQWLVPLWSYRDPEVRASGLGIATSLATTIPGCVYLSKCHEGIPGTLWTTVLAIITDHSECSVVRKQAINLLINLLSHPMAEPVKGPSAGGTTHWEGPKLTNEETQVSISGTSALLALLNYFHFIPNVVTILSYFYPQCTIQPVSVVDNSSMGSSRSGSGPSTVTTPDIPATDEPATGGHSSHQPEGQQVISPVLSEQSSTVPLIAASYQTDDHPSRSVSSEDTQIEPRQGRAPSVVGYLSVVTPGLVASVCGILRQLILVLPEKTILSEGKGEILKQLTRILDPNKAQILILSTVSRLAAIQYIAMCCNSLHLASLWLHQDEEDGVDVTKLISKTCQLLHIPVENTKDPSVKSSQFGLIESCFNFLSISIQQATETNAVEISASHWFQITAIIISLVKHTVPCSTRLSAFAFLAHILSGNMESSPDSCQSPAFLEAALERQHQAVLDYSHLILQLIDTCALWSYSSLVPKPNCPTMQERIQEFIKGEDGITDASRLCQLLLAIYDGTATPCLNHNPLERPTMVAALKNLLAKSQSAKVVALNAGFVESLVDDAKSCHVKLTAESLASQKKKSKKKESNLLKQIKVSLEVLQSFMYQNADVKVAAHQANLSLVVQKLWAWIISSRPLLATALGTLTTFTSHCHPACLSLSRSPPGTTNSLMYYLIKLAEKQKLVKEKDGGDGIIQRRVFEVLTNASWYEECRNILWKSGFLSNLSQFRSLKSKSSKSPQTQQSLHLWLKLLVILTFSPDGQQMVIKIPEILDLLLEFVKWSHPEISHTSILVLHNLCFLGANKNKLLSNEQLVPVFLEKFESGKLKEQFAVTSALWSALHGNQKVKAIMKANNLHARAREKIEDVKRNLQMPVTDQVTQELLVKHHSALTCLVGFLGD